MADNIGTTYLDIEPRLVSLESKIKEAEARVQQSALRMEKMYNSINPKFDNALAKKSISEIEQIGINLRKTLEKKLELGRPLEDLQMLKYEIEQCEGAVKNFKTKAKEPVPETGGFFGGMLTQLKGMLVSLGVIGVLIKGLNFAKSIIETAAAFQTLETRLTSLYGSADRAAKVFAIVKDVAATTPFSLREVTEGAIALKSFGLRVEDTIKPLADLAAFMGISVPEAASAWGRAFAAGAGAADIFRERGVLNLIKMRTNIDDLTKLTLPEFRKAMMDAFTDPGGGIAGSTDRLSKTFKGAFSNMQDAFDSFKEAIGRGFIPILSDMARAITSVVNALTPYESELNKTTQRSDEARAKFDILATTIERLAQKQNLSKTELEIYTQKIKEMDAEYGTHLENLQKEGKSWLIIKDSIKQAREELIKKAKTDALLAVTKDWREQSIQKTRELIELEDQLSDLQNQIKNRPAKTSGQVIDYQRSTDYLQNKIDEANQYIQDRADWQINLERKNPWMNPGNKSTPENTETVRSYEVIKQEIDRLEASLEKMVPKSKEATDTLTKITKLKKEIDTSPMRESLTGIASMDREFKADNLSWADQFAKLAEMRKSVSSPGNKEFEKDANKREMILNQLTIKERELQEKILSWDIKTEQLKVDMMEDGVAKKIALAKIWYMQQYADIENNLKDENKAKDARETLLTAYYKKIEGIRSEDAEKTALYDKQYAAQQAEFEKNQVDTRIRNYQLSVDEYKAYLDKQLELQIQALEAKNTAIEKWNKEHPEDQKALFDIQAYRTAGQAENTVAANRYGGNKTDAEQKQWEKDHPGTIEGAKTAQDVIKSGFDTMYTQIEERGRVADLRLKEVFTNMAKSFGRSIAEMIEKWVAFQLLVNGLNMIAPGVGDFVGKALGIGSAETGGTGSGGGLIAGEPTISNVGKMARNNSSDVGSGLQDINNSIQAMNLNMLHETEIKGNLRVYVEGELSGDNIHYANKKAAELKRRFN